MTRQLTVARQMASADPGNTDLQENVLEALWQLAGSAGWVNPLFLPAPLSRLNQTERAVFLAVGQTNDAPASMTSWPPLLTTSAKCMELLASTEEFVEGLVFKAPDAKGFEDTSIIRCRKRR